MSKENYLRVPITMPEEMFAYLESVSIRSKVSGGRKLANTVIVRASIMAMMDLDVDVNGVKDEEELKERIIKAQTSYKKK
ncbi:MAG: hypothetical protein COW32_07705 [Candidatus Aquicultor secundus]|uniref:CopG family transcriptional regulator n=1 Tax=Candidatus Aquicultor secundus TaxID=1973895 RepID=A0A2M7T6E7_9ACTN|nr:hypothetical protein [Candidatus Aquicultor secundus]NCO65605.1 hypothetical protein [Solirubrobacter sp.]OIO86525.1 MAG: hypothetical protein AUK32_05375 [Candidatus Aquicultor secundus]PIU27054.1 MAG: hypothetical protein COT10_05410 [Candidatus Aquicultor secundus]PIW21836.1 MAG: hypothetical protein COW32_07705 [Candidatus Aquicultor secundus]PIX52502.1 MAG: hypothetical protein COZ51_03775 [Candidatus Aquicultor secundus]